MALGRRCDAGCESWPDEKQYATCPLCGEATTRFRNLQPLEPEEARQRVFDVFYEGWCFNKKQPTDGPLPNTPEESLFWAERYPDGRPDAPAPAADAG